MCTKERFFDLILRLFTIINDCSQLKTGLNDSIDDAKNMTNNQHLQETLCIKITGLLKLSYALSQ